VTTLLGLDLGGTNVKCAVLEADERGPRVVATASAPNAAEHGPDEVLRQIVALGLETLDGRSAAAAGLGLPGHFDPGAGTGVLLPNLPGDWVGRAIAAPVAEGLGIDTHLVNDCRALTLAELRLGAGRGARDLVCVALGTGVGGGVVIDGRLHLGLAHAGELGHQTVDPDGPRCGCGNRGCLDRMAGAAAIASYAGTATVAEAVSAARTGDEQAEQAFRRAADYVGIAVSNAIVLLWPERVVVGGGVAEAGDLLFEPLREVVAERAQVAPVERIEIVPAALGPAAGAVGAALWAGEAP
jgi:glucokinase